MNKKHRVIVNQKYRQVFAESVNNLINLIGQGNAVCIAYQTDAEYNTYLKEIYKISTDTDQFTLVTFTNKPVPSALMNRINCINNPDQKELYQMLQDNTNVVILKPSNVQLHNAIMSRCVST